MSRPGQAVRVATYPEVLQLSRLPGANGLRARDPHEKVARACGSISFSPAAHRPFGQKVGA
eukprot:7796026-Alexandrium_andersonii.AAC.1